MKYGVFQFSTDYAIRIDELAREVEGRSLESLFVPEHTHIPASRRSPWPGGADLPREYWHTLDPFVSLAAAAAVHRALKLGTGHLSRDRARSDHACQGGREPRLTSRAAASCSASAAAGTRRRWLHHGTDFGARWKVLRERIAAMKAIWTMDEAEYHGEHVKFDKLWSYPEARAEAASARS